MNEVEIARYAAHMNRTNVELMESGYEAAGLADFHEPVDVDEWPPSGGYSPHEHMPWWRGVWATPTPKPHDPDVCLAGSAFTDWRVKL